MEANLRSIALRYGISLVALFLAFALRLLLEPYLGARYPYATFLLPVVLVAQYAGLGPSILTIGGALFLASYYFVEPRRSLVILAPADQMGFLLYTCSGAAVVMLAHSLRKGQRETELREMRSRRLAEAVRESEERLRLVLQASKMGWWHWDLTTDRVTADAQTKALFGLPADAEVSFDTFLERLAPGETARVLEELPAALASPDDFESEFHLIWSDGSSHWISTRGRVFCNAQGQPRRTMGVVMDITDRKQSEERFREHMLQLQTITDHAHDFIARFDSDLRYLFANRAISEALHIPVEEIVGRTSQELGMSAELCEFCNQRLRRVFQTGQPEQMEYAHEIDGVLRSFSSLIVPERSGEQGQVETVLVITRDVSDAKRVEAALKTWNEELEAKVAERTAVAQERATQLQMLAIELSEAEERERRRLARILHDHLQQLLVASRMRLSVLRRQVCEGKAMGLIQQIDGLLDQCLAESRSLTMELSPAVLYEAGLKAGLEWLARQAEEKHHLRVVVDADPAAEPQGETKRVFLFQAARELLLNIVKHARTAEAWVGLELLDNQRLRLVVEDRGQGMDLTELERRGKSSGFGLFSIRERLEVLGGRMEVETAPGQGTRIVIEMGLAGPATSPLEPAAEPVAIAEPPVVEKGSEERPQPGKTRVVLVDDHAIVRQGLAGLLREHQAIEIVGEASDGAQAVEMTKRIRPDVVVMDITLPKLTGIEATRHIVQAVPDVRVIGLSMHHDADMSLAMRKAGAVAYFSKDVAADDLLAAILPPHVQA